MLLVDTVQGRLIDDDELKEYYASKQPYGEWLDSNLVCLKDLKIPNMKVEEHSYKKKDKKLQKAFGYTYEDVMTSILPMAKNGTRSIAAMGTGSPLAVLSKNRSRFSTTSNSSLHRLQTRRLTQSVRKL